MRKPRSLALLLKKASFFIKNVSKSILLLTQVGIFNPQIHCSNKIHFLTQGQLRVGQFGGGGGGGGGAVRHPQVL